VWQEKRRVIHKGNLNEEKKRRGIEFVAPSTIYSFALTFLSPLLLPPCLLPLRSTNMPLHHDTRATKTQVPDPSKRGISRGVDTIFIIASPTIPTHLMGDKGLSRHCDYTLPSWCSPSSMFGIPTVLIRCRILRMFERETLTKHSRSSSRGYLYLKKLGEGVRGVGLVRKFFVLVD